MFVRNFHLTHTHSKKFIRSDKSNDDKMSVFVSQRKLFILINREVSRGEKKYLPAESAVAATFMKIYPTRVTNESTGFIDW